MNLLLYAAGEPATAIVVDVLKIAGRNKPQVSKVLGSAKCQHERSGENCLYRHGKIEIVFVRGKADWITVYNLGDHPFSTKTLRALGLPEEMPTFSNDHVMRWSGLAGLREVSLFPKPGGVDYAYILTKTAP